MSTIFFFSSRRRHTRSKRDWSSDVCSSDLTDGEQRYRVRPTAINAEIQGPGWLRHRGEHGRRRNRLESLSDLSTRGLKTNPGLLRRNLRLLDHQGRLQFSATLLQERSEEHT